MTKGKRVFDWDKYSNSPHALTDEQNARLQLAREEARQMRPSVFWLRAAESLALSLLMIALVGWLADWSTLRTGIVIVVYSSVWAAVSIFVWWYLRRPPRSP